MSIGIFSIGLLCYIVYIIVRIKTTKGIFVRLVGLSVAVQLFVRMGYFIRIGDKYITYNSFLSYLLLVFVLLFLVDKSVKKKKYHGIVILFVIAVFINLFLRIVMPYNESIVFGNWEQYLSTVTHYIEYNYSSFYGAISDRPIQFGNYIVVLVSAGILLIAKAKFGENEYKTVSKIITIFAKAEIVIGIIEFVCKFFLKSTVVTQINILIFGQYGWQHSSLVQRGFLYELVGTTKEASMLSFSIFFTLIFFLILNHKNIQKGNRIWLGLAVVLLLLTPALSSYVYFVIFILMYTVLFSKHPRKVLTYACSVALFVIFAFIVLISKSQELMNSDIYIFNRISFAMNQFSKVFQAGSTLDYTSEAIRFGGINNAIELIPNRPLFGYGIGDITCDSGFFSLVTNIGVIGSLLWLLCIYHFIYDQSKYKANCALFVVFSLILPNLLLNDFDTVTMLAVPILGALMGIYTDCFSTMKVRTKNERN